MQTYIANLNRKTGINGPLRARVRARKCRPNFYSDKSIQRILNNPVLGSSCTKPKTRSAAWSFQSSASIMTHFRLVSLAYMLMLPLGKFVDALGKLNSFDSIVGLLIEQDGDVSIEDDMYQSFCADVQMIASLCDSLGLRVSQQAANNLVAGVGSFEPIEALWNLTNMKARFLKTKIDQLIACIRHEAAITVAITLPPASIHLYEQLQPLFGETVAREYPSAAYDISEAGKSLALGRYTACVFHLMRAVEIGIKAVYAGLNLPDFVKAGDRNWGSVLGKIEKEIKTRNSSQPTKWTSDTEKKFYELVYASGESVRLAWRNSTMHVENKYTEDEAEQIMAVVKGFMRKIAANIDESGLETL